MIKKEHKNTTEAEEGKPFEFEDFGPERSGEEDGDSGKPEEELEEDPGVGIAERRPCERDPLVRYGVESEALRGELAALRETLEKMELGLGQVGEGMHTLASRDQVAERLSAELKRLDQRFWDEHVTSLIVRSLFPVYNMITDSQKECAEVGAASLDVKGLLEAVECELRGYLEAHGVEPFRHKRGARFNSKLMRPARLVVANDKRLDLRVAESLRAGFRLHDRILRSEAVVVWRFQQTKGSGESEKKEMKNVARGNRRREHPDESGGARQTGRAAGSAE